MWFRVRPADVTFAATAKKQLTYDVAVAGSGAAAFRAVTEPEALMRWMTGVKSAKWLTSAPHGVGSVREVHVPGIAVHEKVLVWEPGERFVFCVVRANVPLLKRMVEDFRMTRMESGTRVQWTVAYQPLLLASPLEFVLTPRFSKMFQEGSAQLARYVAAGS